MEDDARDQRSAIVEDQHQHEAHKDGEHDLNKGGDHVLSAAVEQIDDVAQAEGQGGDDDRRSQAVLLHGPEQQSAENDLLQKAHAAHADDKGQRVRKAVLQPDPVPEGGRRDDGQGEIVQKPLCGHAGSAKAVFCAQAVFPYPEKQHQGHGDVQRGGDGFDHADALRQPVRQTAQDHVAHDPEDRKGHLVLFIQFRHLFSFSPIPRRW